MPVLENESAATTSGEIEKPSPGYRGGAMGYRRALCFLCLQYGISDYHHQAVKHFSFPLSGTWSGQETAGSAYLNATEHV